MNQYQRPAGNLYCFSRQIGQFIRLVLMIAAGQKNATHFSAQIVSANSGQNHSMKFLLTIFYMN